MSIKSGSEHIVQNREDELSRVQRTFEKLAPMCTVEKRAKGIPQLAPQQKQMGILKQEMEETLLCINVARQRRNQVKIANAKKDIYQSVLEYENLLMKLREEKAQQTELDTLNYLTNKCIINLTKEVPSESDELHMLERANNRLRRMENRLDLSTKRLSSINTSNKVLREEINRLLVERRTFNVQWQNAIGKLVRGKNYLMDIYEGATAAFAKRDEYCKKLEVLKWKGLFQLNKDIADMQYYQGDINYLSKLEEFLRVKCSTRICEADVKMEIELKEETARCEEAIAKYDDQLQEIFDFASADSVSSVIKPFRENEIKIASLFALVCDVQKENMFLWNELDIARQRVLDTSDEKEAMKEKQARQLAQLRMELAEQRRRTQRLKELNNDSEAKFNKFINNIDELVRISKCEVTPLLKLLGRKNTTKFNVHRYLSILELEVKNLVQVVYGAVKPPTPVLTPKTQKGPRQQTKKIVADPYVEIIRPNKIEKLVNYIPCAYCVEEYIMNQVFETPAVPADKEYIEGIFHLDVPNTKFGIYTLTIEGRRHKFPGYQNSKDN